MATTDKQGQADQSKAADDAAQELAKRSAVQDKINEEKQAADDATTGEFRVVCAGLVFALPSAKVATEFAMRGALINLDAKQADRLKRLGCVVAKEDPDPDVMLVASANPDNPFGGVPQVSAVEQAQRAVAEAHAQAAADGAVQQ